MSNTIPDKDRPKVTAVKIVKKNDKPPYFNITFYIKKEDDLSYCNQYLVKINTTIFENVDFVCELKNFSCTINFGNAIFTPLNYLWELKPSTVDISIGNETPYTVDDVTYE